MSAADSFTYFHALPTELRLQIWGEALAVRSVWAAVRNYSADRDLSASRLPFIMVYIGPAPYLAGLSSREARRLLEQSYHAGSKKSRTAKISPHPTTKFTPNFWRTMEPEDHYQHHETPTKAKIQGAIEFCERMNISYYKNDVFRTFNVSKRQGYEMLRPDSSS